MKARSILRADAPARRALYFVKDASLTSSCGTGAALAIKSSPPGARCNPATAEWKPIPTQGKRATPADEAGIGVGTGLRPSSSGHRWTELQDRRQRV